MFQKIESNKDSKHYFYLPRLINRTPGVVVLVAAILKNVESHKYYGISALLQLEKAQGFRVNCPWKLNLSTIFIIRNESFQGRFLEEA